MVCEVRAARNIFKDKLTFYSATYLILQGSFQNCTTLSCLQLSGNNIVLPDFTEDTTTTMQIPVPTTDDFSLRWQCRRKESIGIFPLDNVSPILQKITHHLYHLVRTHWKRWFKLSWRNRRLVMMIMKKACRLSTLYQSKTALPYYFFDDCFFW